ncbi:MAG: hypothetical protein KJZ54_11895 [Phycisphaerales bacterium]|nr:hypothetical protein [Phycisphaerales bacterium]
MSSEVCEARGWDEDGRAIVVARGAEGVEQETEGVPGGLTPLGPSA